MRDKSLFISKNLFEEILAHCREAYPNEACGILAGKPMARRGSEALNIYKMANIEKS